MTDPDIQHFLVVYDIGREAARIEEFGTRYDAALRAYEEREREFRFDPQVEVVLLGADSLETIKKTHSSYFLAPGEHAFAAAVRRAAARG